MLSKLSKNFSAQMFSIVQSSIDRFFVVGLLLRVLGTDVYADWVLLLSFAGMISLAEMGLNIYYGNAWQKAYTIEDPAEFQRILGFALSCAVGMAIFQVVIIFGIVLFYNLSQNLSLKITSEYDAVLVFVALALAVSSRNARGSISQIYRGRQAFAVGILVDLVAPTLITLAIPVTALLGGKLVAMAVVYLCCDLVAGWGVMLFDLRRRYPDLQFRPQRPKYDELADLGRNIRWFAIQQAAPVVWIQAPTLLIGWLGASGPQLISFTLLRTLVNLARQLGSVLSLSVSVELATSYHAGNRDAFIRQIHSFGAWLTGVVCIFVVAIALFGDAFLVIWTGNSTLFNPWIAIWLLAGALVFAPAMVLSATLMHCNIPRPGAIANLFQVSLGLGAATALAPRYGAAGVAAGLAIGEFVAMSVIFPVLSARALELDYGRYIVRCFGVMVVCLAWGGTSGTVLMSVIKPDGLASLCSMGFVWVVFGVLPPLFLILSSSQRQAVLNAARNFLTFAHGKL